MSYDALVVGGGIAGMESALSLGDMGLNVLLVERDASIGGKMILLSKVFPTLDCASCIATPKMASTAHHPNVTTMVSTEVEEIRRREDERFDVHLRKKATFVDPAACTGCGDCEIACTVSVPDEYNFGLAARRVAHIPFPQAIPKKSVIDRLGTSPCTFDCPAGVKAHGYVSLVRAGRYEEAFRLHMEDAPLPGSLSRACYAPCEDACTRGELEAPVPIRQIKRFMVDRYYADHPEPEYGPPETKTGKRVAIVGSGPAGLTAAYFLAKEGHSVTIFEAAPKPGGMLRYGIPAYRLPRDVLDRDIKNITALGVEIRCGARIRSVVSLQEQGFHSVFLAVGTRETWKLNVPGEDLDEVEPCMDFLSRANSGQLSSLEGKRVVVVGGGNAAIDSARMAARLGASHVMIMYRRGRDQMPAHNFEVQSALDEGVALQTLRTPIGFVAGESGRLGSILVQHMRLGEPDDSGRRRPIPVPGSDYAMDADLVVLATGLRPCTEPFRQELAERANGTFVVDEDTLETSIPGIFAGGDAATGSSMIVQAIAQGHRAAVAMSRKLLGEESSLAAFNHRLPVVDKADVLARAFGVSERECPGQRSLTPQQAVHTMHEVELGLTEEQARYAANRCLDCGECSECHECINACPADAIDFSLRDQELDVEVGSVVLATGFQLFDARRKVPYGFGRYPNVIDAMQMDRLLAPTRPFNSVLRPSDGKQPENIAFVLCTGSRDCTMDNSLCSRVCCMYSIKQAQLLMGALPMADVTIYYIDIRAFGKGYEEFYRQSEGMGVNYVKGKVAEIHEKENGDVTLIYEDIEGGGGRVEADHDLVVLSVGLLANPVAADMFGVGELAMDSFSYVSEVDEDLSPGKTSIPGVFAAGSTTAVRDIPDTILHAGAAAVQAAAYALQGGREQ